MLKSIGLANFTVFQAAHLGFGKHLNIIIGANGTGKSHLLKLAYTTMQASWELGNRPSLAGTPPTKTALQTHLAEKLVSVFRPEQLGRLARRRQGRERSDIQLRFDVSALDLDFSFATNSKSEVAIEKLPRKWQPTAPAYLPTRELLSIYPGFVSLYDSHYIPFEETWRDTCLLLGKPLQKGPKEKRIKELLSPLEAAMEGCIELDSSGRFYLRNASGRMEIPLVAEGLRKLGMLARLIATGALLDKGYLFWDEPEANLNPRLIREVARTVVELSKVGIQVFLATHSLFLLRELEILLAKTANAKLHTHYFGLHSTDQGVQVQQGTSIADIGDIASLDESLLQSDRYLDAEV